MKQVDEMPKEGQFVAVWEFGGSLWSDTVMIGEHPESILVYNTDADQWIEDVWHDPENAKFFIK